MAKELDLRRPAAQVLASGVDEPEPDVLLRARPAVNRMIELDRGIDIFVPLMQVRGKVHVAFRVERHPVERVSQFGAVAGLGHVGRWITGFVLEYAVRVNTRFTASERIANLDVGGKIAARRGAWTMTHL